VILVEDDSLVREYLIQGVDELARGPALCRRRLGLHAQLAVPAGRLGLGAQAGEARLRQVARYAGFSRLRRAARTPVNLVLELTP
jgi:hypothetical protein